MLSTADTHGLTSAYWPADRSEPVLDQTIGEALREAASRHGSRTALIDVMPRQLKGCELENFIRDGIATVWHQACTAKMGRDPMSVVDHQLKVYGIENLRIADASVMPRVTTGNTMAPCVVIGERCAEMVRRTHRI